MENVPVLCNGMETKRFIIRGILEYDVKHNCPCCPGHHIDLPSHQDIRIYKGQDPEIESSDELAWWLTPKGSTITNLKWKVIFELKRIYDVKKEEPNDPR